MRQKTEAITKDLITLDFLLPSLIPIRTTLSSSPPASFPVPSTQCTVSSSFSSATSPSQLSVMLWQKRLGPLLLFPPSLQTDLPRCPGPWGRKEWNMTSNRARTTRSTANAVFQFCSSNSKLRPILLPSLDFPSFTMLPFKLIS